MKHWTRRLAPAIILFMVSCGARSLDSPEFLPRTVYAVGAKQMTFVMTTCSDTCKTYEEAVCTVELDKDTSQLIVDVSVAFNDSDNTDACGVTCGPTIYAHCDLPALSTGRYQVIAGSFETSIEIR